MLLLYPNIDEQRVLVSEQSWQHVAKWITEALDGEAVAAFDQLWLCATRASLRRSRLTRSGTDPFSPW